MSYATLLHGEPAEVMDLLDSGTDEKGLLMAVTNAFLRIQLLESRRPALNEAPQVDAAHYTTTMT